MKRWGYVPIGCFCWPGMPLYHKLKGLAYWAFFCNPNFSLFSGRNAIGKPGIYVRLFGWSRAFKRSLS